LEASNALNRESIRSKRLRDAVKPFASLFNFSFNCLSAVAVSFDNDSSFASLTSFIESRAFF